MDSAVKVVDEQQTMLDTKVKSVRSHHSSESDMDKTGSSLSSTLAMTKGQLEEIKDLKHRIDNINTLRSQMDNLESQKFKEEALSQIEEGSAVVNQQLLSMLRNEKFDIEDLRE